MLTYQVLQRRYEDLKKSHMELFNELARTDKELKKYKSRNEKTIKYLKYQLENLNFEEDIKAKMLCAMTIILLDGED